jgi:hypothetical protein
MVAVGLLWRTARSAEKMAEDSKASLKIAEASNRELQRRIEAAEAKLTRAIDEMAIDWSPAYARLEAVSTDRIKTEGEYAVRRLTDSWKSFNRRASRGYLEGDDYTKPPPQE